MLAKVCDPRDDGLSSFADAIAYVTRSGRVSHWVINELHSLVTAAAQMRFTSETCLRCRDALYHLVISWPEGERPTNAQVEAAARHLLKRIGFLEHQWVLAVHRDTDTVHVHVIVCRVHPDTGRAHSPWEDWITLDRACREVELAQGWAHDNGLHRVDEVNGKAAVVKAPRTKRAAPRLSDKARRYERSTGEMSFQSWVATKPAEIVKTASSWAEVHAAFAELGITIEARGSGHVIVDHSAPKPVAAKVSHMGLSGLKKIERRVGQAYVPPDDTVLAAIRSNGTPFLGGEDAPDDDGERAATIRPRDPNARRQRRLERAEHRDALRDAYRRTVSEEERLRRERRTAWDRQRASERDQRDRLRSEQRRQRAELLSRPLSFVQRCALDSVIAVAAAREREQLEAVFRAERQALQTQFRLRRHTTWVAFLRERAETGDRTAQVALRGLRYRDGRAAQTNRTTPAPVRPAKPEPADGSAADRSPTRTERRPAPSDRTINVARLEGVSKPRQRGDIGPGTPGIQEYNCRLLDRHYGEPIDRSIRNLLRRVDLPSQARDDLIVCLRSHEELTDRGDLISVDSPGAVTADAVAVFVAMVQVKGWQGVILSGDDQWIAAAKAALHAAGIPCRAEGEPATRSEDVKQPSVPATEEEIADWLADPCLMESANDGAVTGPDAAPAERANGPVGEHSGTDRPGADPADLPSAFPPPICTARQAAFFPRRSSIDASGWIDRINTERSRPESTLRMLLYRVICMPGENAVEMQLWSGRRLRVDAGQICVLSKSTAIDPDALAVFVEMMVLSGWREVTLDGDPDWGRQAAAALARHGLPVTNPELFVVFQDHRRRLASDADPGHTPTALEVSSAGDGEPSAAGSVPIAGGAETAPPALSVLSADAQTGVGAAPPAVAPPDSDARHAPLESAVVPRTPAKGGPDGVGAANTPARGGAGGGCPAAPRRFSVRDWDHLRSGASGLLDDWRIDPRVLERYRDSLRHDDGYSCIAHRAVNGTVVGFTVVPPVTAPAVHVPGTEHGLVMFGDRRSCSRVAVTSTALDALALAHYEDSFECERTLYLGLHPKASDAAYEALGSVLRQCRAPRVVLAFTTDQVGNTHEAAVLTRLARARGASGNVLRLSRLRLPHGCTSWIGLTLSDPSNEAVLMEPIDQQAARNQAPGSRIRDPRTHGRDD